MATFKVQQEIQMESMDPTSQRNGPLSLPWKPNPLPESHQNVGKPVRILRHWTWSKTFGEMVENNEWATQDPLTIKGRLASADDANVVTDPSVVRYTLILRVAAAYWRCPELDLLKIIQAVQCAAFSCLHATAVGTSSRNRWICTKPDGQI